MTKNHPGHTPQKKPRRGEPSVDKTPIDKPQSKTPKAALATDAVPGIFTKRFTNIRAGNKLDHRESLTRYAHRLRMKAFLARANSAT